MSEHGRDYYAHIRVNDKGEMLFQTVQEHLNGTAELSGQFADDFGAKPEGIIAGALHDLGKCSEAFQNRLLHDGPKVDHATAGALACIRNNPIVAECIAGHHSGLQDYGNVAADQAGDSTFCGRIKKGIKEQYLEKCDVKAVDIPDIEDMEVPSRDKFKISLRTKMLYSCLVDADYLDTERFMNGGTLRGGYDSMELLLDKLYEYIEPWKNPTSELNKLRCEILNTCIDSGKKAKGIYTLTVPTGGGKTVASLAFALKHAVRHGMKRIIYVIPYTSIIEQNAKVFRDILGDNNVLEHHSGVQYELTENASQEQQRKAYAAENWDMPIIVTTSVQLFESVFASKSSKCRKLHNLANSVVIFDEAQMIPISHLKPCTAVIASLADQFNSTIVLCTATQPALDDLLKEFAAQHEINELCPDKDKMFEAFRRVSYKKIGKIDDTQLADELNRNKQVLCIVNSRKAAQNIYSKIDKTGSYHLSTLMVPEHRRKILKNVRLLLKNGEVCRVISTSLIEAGVDVDFPKVYRELAGLDSIVQAAGRCNREGRRTADNSIVTIFERMELPPKLFRIAIGAANEAMEDDREPGMQETINRYFNSLRSLNGDAIDKEEIIKAFRDGISGCDFPYKTVADKFRFIDSNAYTVYVPYDEEADKLINKIKSGECTKDIFRRLGRYSISVYEEHFRALYNTGALLTAKDVEVLDESSAILNDMTLYTEEMGLSLEPETGKAEFI